MASTPSRITVDALEEIRTTGGGGAGTNVNISGINGSAPALSNPLPVELSDGTNPFGTAGNPLSVNVLSGGGSNASVGLIGAVAPTSATEVGIVDATGKLQHHSGFVLTNSTPAAVAIVDANGNQITSFGGGTQYVDGTTQATPTGTIALGKNPSNVVHALALDAAGNLLVDIAAGGSGAPTPIGSSPTSGSLSLALTAAGVAQGLQVDAQNSLKVAIQNQYPVEMVIVDPETNSPARVDDDGNAFVRLGFYDEAITLRDNIVQWAGVPLAPPNAAGGIRIASGTLSGSFTWTVANSGIGTVVVLPITDASFATLYWTLDSPGSGGLGFVLETSNDPSFATPNLGGVQYILSRGAAFGAATFLNPLVAIGGANGNSSNYEAGIGGFSFIRFRITAALSSGSVSFFWTLTGLPAPPPVAFPQIQSQVGLSEPALVYALQNATNSALPVGVMYNTSAGGNSYVYGRTPHVFKTAQVTAAGSTPVWTPTGGTKFRLMRYQIVLTDNAAANQNGVVTLTFFDAATNLSVSHDFYIPAAPGTGSQYIGPWVDLGNGIISAAANNVLNASLSTPLIQGNFRINVCGTEE
jgi:hypothetical protein